MSNNRGHVAQSAPLSGRFIVNFNGIEKKILLKQSKGDYQIDRLKKKVFAKFKKLGTKDFHIKMNDGSSINSDRDIVLYLLGQNEPLPKCSVFVGIPRFDSDMESISKSDVDDHLLYAMRLQSSAQNEQTQKLQQHHHAPILMHNNGLHNNSPISPLPISFDLASNNQHHHNDNNNNDDIENEDVNNNNNANRDEQEEHNDDDDNTACKHRHGRLNNHNISNLIELKSIVNKHDIYQGHREYICCFNNTVIKMVLTMFDIAKYSDESFKNQFLSLFEYKLQQNESLQFRVYHISTKQYIAIKLPLWSYDSQHYHIEGEVIKINNIDGGDNNNKIQIDDKNENKKRNHKKKKRNSRVYRNVNNNNNNNDDNDDDDDDKQQEIEEEEEEEQEEDEVDDDDNWSSVSIYDFDDVLNGLESELKSQQKQFEEMISNINQTVDMNVNININLWKKYKFEIYEIERDINIFCSNCHLRLNRDLSDHLNTKCRKLKEFGSIKLNKINELQHEINCTENEIIDIEKAIHSLTIQKLEYEEDLKLKHIKIKKEELIWNSTQKQLSKLTNFHSKYEITKKQLNGEIVEFEKEGKNKIYDIQKNLNNIWKRFEFNYQCWNIDESIQWILCIENFHFQHNKFNHFIETLKTHKFIGKNLKELRSNFTLNVMGLKNENDQQILIKNINRIITKTRRKSSKMRQQQQMQIIQRTKSMIDSSSYSEDRAPPIYNKRKSGRNTIKLPFKFDINHNIPSSISNDNESSPPSSNQGNLCCICAENEINTVIIPCGHMVYCSKCSKKLTITTCPTCRSKDVKIMITYKSGL